MFDLQRRVRELLERADIEPNGSRPWDIQIHDERFYARVLRQGSIGLGESYMDGWWSAPMLDQFFDRALRARLDGAVANRVGEWITNVAHAVFNFQSEARAFMVGKKHYDIGNDLYMRMLDERMVYTCGYWHFADSLANAQVAKLDLICDKIGLQRGDRVLDIGCGWGSFAKHAALAYGAEVVGVSVSIEQTKFARERCRGLPVEFRVQDYRTVNERFDHIVSIGMFEAVGHKNYRAYMEMVHRCLKPDGLFLLHTIGGNKSERATDPWLHRHIFPNGLIPSIAQIGTSIEGLFSLRDWHVFGGAHYDRTLMVWNERFQRAWPELSGMYDEQFKRRWEYYLLSCAGSFRAGRNNLWQLILSRPDKHIDYVAVR